MNPQNELGQWLEKLLERLDEGPDIAALEQIEEVRAELKAAGLDTTPLLTRIRERLLTACDTDSATPTVPCSPGGEIGTTGSSSVAVWAGSDDRKAWVAVLRTDLFRRLQVMSDDTGDFEAVIDSPPPVRDFCPWAEKLKFHKSSSGLTVEAIGPEAADSTSSLKVWIAERPEQVQTLANDDRIGVFDTSGNEPCLLLTVKHREEPS